MELHASLPAHLSISHPGKDSVIIIIKSLSSSVSVLNPIIYKFSLVNMMRRANKRVGMRFFKGLCCEMFCFFLHFIVLISNRLTFLCPPLL